MGELAKVAEAVSAPIVKFIDVVSRGIGCAYEPTHTRKMADAKAYEIATIAKALRDNADLPVFFDRDGVQIDLRDMNALAERASRRALLQEMRKQQNIEAVVDKAYEELKNETVVSSEPVNDDWIVRFFNSVEDVSNDELREIWGRILAGEIKKPRSFPLRTLDILKNISVQEAILFEKISHCILENGNKLFIPMDSNLFDKFGGEFDSIFTLSGAGIINLVPLELTLNVDENDEFISSISSKTACILKCNRTGNYGKIKLTCYVLTDSGFDIYRVINKDLAQCREFAQEFYKYLMDTYRQFSILAYDFEGNDYKNFESGLNS